MQLTSPSQVAIIGQGYVGLPAAYHAVLAGHHVTGYDVDGAKIDALRNGQSPIEDVTDAQLTWMLSTGRYNATDCESDLPGFTVALVTVPTPLTDGRPDLTFVLNAAGTLARHLAPGVLVVLESTVAPGTTAGEFADALEKNPAGWTVRGGELLVGFSPERIDPGNHSWHFGNTPKLVSGVNSASAEATYLFYATMCSTVVGCPSTATAEMAKLLENTYRHVNIALVNELSRHAHALGVSIWDVVDAARTKPYGYQAFYPGPGVGGHCLPVDPAYLSDRVERTLGRSFDFVDLAIKVNDAQPDYVVERATRLLNERKRSVNGSRVLVLGMSYKADSGDVRETPATRIVSQLHEMGADVSVCDPLVVNLAGYLSQVLAGVKVIDVADVLGAAAAADLTILVTDHADFPYEDLAREAGLILDTRNRFARIAVGAHAL
ncbi:MAG TPA: nucleotide sugar dehydrogenase [Micromonosporaceae bacterium]|nr:nucleotide sugar dehydrogenase [Micromonosporaceae bacterium]